MIRDLLNQAILLPLTADGEMQKIPPVYRLYFTNEAALKVTDGALIDASDDDEAIEKAEALLALNPKSAATLWADSRMLRQFVSTSAAEHASAPPIYLPMESP